ncbi:EFR1 family ferrodoxin [Clostridium sp. DJ247]|uniref:EFR1 family ferrodoxin n=1 Tax=Clostridium sp. DJ247 TaxID=2726188 RepID=UPI001623EE57|nr:EFR1 family ferrodoxin [Clostridium sp. DJ247]MBC2582629.1 4Fe-4S ferredoxin [Clostridium sp. DJ247]
MIFYFSGTGNSLQVAKNIAEHNDEKLISIASKMNSKGGKFDYTLKDNEIIGFVYPVYAWAPPKMVLDFINKLKLNNYKDNYIFSVATCGGNIGNTMKVMSIALKKNNLDLDSGFSISMPSNYIIMGDVDSKEEEHRKLLAAEETLKNINYVVKERKKKVFQVVKGHMPGILTGIINPLFNKGAMNTKKFYANDNCTGCGICQSVCNCNNIKIEEKPKWGKICSLCLACIHFCPVRAVQYGKETERKGRYKNPNVSVEEMRVNR